MPVGSPGNGTRVIQDDFELVCSPEQRFREKTLPGPYWEPALDLMRRESSFLGRILRDFAYTWRHVIRQEMNMTTLRKLAYAVIWSSRIQFTLLERIGFEYVSEGGPYVKVVDLPSWDAPEATLVSSGSSCFVLSQDIREGLEMVRRHATSRSLRNTSTAKPMTYAILTVRRIVLCKAHRDELAWTRSEKLFDDKPTSDTAINFILNASITEHQPITINFLPAEIQDRILRYATASVIAAAKLGCELGLGSPFSWVDRSVAISISETKRHRGESSPVESQLVLNGKASGLSYKRERGCPMIHSCRKAPPTTQQV
jgi:hypothetical protein